MLGGGVEPKNPSLNTAMPNGTCMRHPSPQLCINNGAAASTLSGNMEYEKTS